MGFVRPWSGLMGGCAHSLCAARHPRGPKQMNKTNPQAAEGGVLHHPVALKIIDARIAADPNVPQRFFREARGAASAP
jgi:hypothetical protein